MKKRNAENSARYLLSTVFVALIFVVAVTAQNGPFRRIVEKRVAPQKLSVICDLDGDAAQRRVFKDYGAIFVASGVVSPSSCIFETEAAVAGFQTSAGLTSGVIGGVRVTLQPAALAALQAASDEAVSRKLRISPRGGTIASTRGFQNTLDLWRGRVEGGLNHWVRAGRISRQEATAARALGVRAQVARILAWEDDGIWFSTYRNKSILYSVAAPGASQHIFGLALDVTQYGDSRVRAILAKHGWHRTVFSDEPHFTYLGVTEDKLPGLGLRAVDDRTMGRFWIPDFE